MCTCVRAVNRQLTDNGARLATISARDRNGNRLPPRVVVHTVNENPLQKRRVLAVATHCPFCGTKYED